MTRHDAPPALTAHTAPPAITHYENFPVASLLCPPHLRAPIAAIYHFARTADDLADEGPATAAQRLEDLARYRRALDDAAAGRPEPGAPEFGADAAGARWPHVFGPLRAQIHRHALPVQLLHDLLDAFEQDVAMSARAGWYARDADVLDYCRRSANPVGRLLLHLYGVSDPAALAQSDAVCTALQLINFWQDVQVDVARGRYYFSEETLSRHGVAKEALVAGTISPASVAMVRAACDEARALMLRGAPLVHRVPGRAGWELRLVVQGGLRILERIAALGWRTQAQRPVLRAADYALLAWRSLGLGRAGGTMAP